MCDSKIEEFQHMVSDAQKCLMKILEKKDKITINRVFYQEIGNNSENNTENNTENKYHLSLNFLFKRKVSQNDTTWIIELTAGTCGCEEKTFEFMCGMNDLHEFLEHIEKMTSYFTRCRKCRTTLCFSEIFPDSLTKFYNKNVGRCDTGFEFTSLEYQYLYLEDNEPVCEECFTDLLFGRSELMSLFTCDICANKICAKMKYEAEGDCAKHLKNICTDCIETCNWKCPICKKDLE